MWRITIGCLMVRRECGGIEVFEMTVPEDNLRRWGHGSDSLVMMKELLSWLHALIKS